MNGSCLPGVEEVNIQDNDDLRLHYPVPGGMTGLEEPSEAVWFTSVSDALSPQDIPVS